MQKEGTKMVTTNESSRSRTEGLFVIRNGNSTGAFPADERIVCNDAHGAAQIASKLALTAVLVESSQNWQQWVTNAEGQLEPHGVMAISYVGQRALEGDPGGQDVVVHGVFFVDDAHTGGLSEVARTAYGAHAMRVTPTAADARAVCLREGVALELQSSGYKVGGDEQATLLQMPIIMEQHQPEEAYVASA
jgi:hypothetical protein